MIFEKKKKQNLYSKIKTFIQFCSFNKPNLKLKCTINSRNKKR